MFLHYFNTMDNTITDNIINDNIIKDNRMNKKNKIKNKTHTIQKTINISSLSNINNSIDNINSIDSIDNINNINSIDNVNSIDNIQHIIDNVNNSVDNVNSIDNIQHIIDNVNSNVSLNESENVSVGSKMSGGIDIDNILNNNLSLFDNKHHTAMFFVVCKSISIINKLLHDKYNINIPKDILENSITTIIPKIIKEYNGNNKKRYKKNMPTDTLCLGRKLDTKQCSRKKHNGTEFCKSHSRKLSNGRIDQPLQIISKSKRGRKRKVQFDPRQYDNEYITLWEDIIEGYKVLVDNNNNIYSFDISKPVYLGKKDINFKLDITKLKELLALQEIQAIQELTPTIIIAPELNEPIPIHELASVAPVAVVAVVEPVAVVHEDLQTTVETVETVDKEVEIVKAIEKVKAIDKVKFKVKVKGKGKNNTEVIKVIPSQTPDVDIHNNMNKLYI